MLTSNEFRAGMRRTLLILATIVVLLVGLLAIRVLYVFRDRNPGFQISLNLGGGSGSVASRALRVGFGRRTINPDLSNARRPVWIAGFDQGRAATAQHDDLWTVACVIDDGRTRIGIVGLDSIGMFHDDLLAVRTSLPPEWRLDYTIVTSTHNHSTPDLMGLWGPNIFRSGVNPDYLHQVQAAIRESLGDAVTSLQDARLGLCELPLPHDGLVADSRKPIVFDDGLRLMVFTRPDSGAVIGSLVTWADHPETPWGRNTEITADFPGVLRESLEKGIRYDGIVRMPGLGGTHLYINGAIGGLMTTNPDTVVRDPFTGLEIRQPSHDKSRAVGNTLAQRILERLVSSPLPPEDSVAISVRARTVELRIDNTNFLLAPILGLLDRGHVRWKTLRTEVAFVAVGQASIACVPGEIYPEIVNGGIVRAPGGDYDIAPVEVPPLRALMPGRVKFVFGLANDEIGYIIPKSEWDEKPPWLFGSPRQIYGEVNSTGPDTAGLLHQALRRLIEEPVSGASQ
jgi:hypothetical protein